MVHELATFGVRSFQYLSIILESFNVEVKDRPGNVVEANVLTVKVPTSEVADNAGKGYLVSMTTDPRVDVAESPVG